jgi:hypothetical protein
VHNIVQVYSLWYVIFSTRVSTPFHVDSYIHVYNISGKRKQQNRDSTYLVDKGDTYRVHTHNLLHVYMYEIYVVIHVDSTPFLKCVQLCINILTRIQKSSSLPQEDTLIFSPYFCNIRITVYVQPPPFLIVHG